MVSSVEISSVVVSSPLLSVDMVGAACVVGFAELSEYVVVVVNCVVMSFAVLASVMVSLVVVSSIVVSSVEITALVVSFIVVCSAEELSVVISSPLPSVIVVGAA